MGNGIVTKPVSIAGHNARLLNLFAAADNFAHTLAAQGLLGLGISLVSGTQVALPGIAAALTLRMLTKDAKSLRQAA